MIYDPTDLNGIERRKAEDKAKERTSLKVEEDGLKWLMGQKHGRAFVWRLLEDAGVFRISFNTNAMQMAFNEGNRSYGNKLLAQVNSLCPEQYAVMQKEALNGRNDGSGSNTN